jgi:hypothetical protein
MPRFSTGTPAPALNLDRYDLLNQLPFNFGSSKVHLLPDSVAQLSREALDFIFSSGSGIKKALHHSSHFIELTFECFLQPQSPSSQPAQDLTFLNRPHVFERSFCPKGHAPPAARCVRPCIPSCCRPPQPPSNLAQPG